MAMSEKERWYAMKAYSMMSPDKQDIFDFLFNYEGYFDGNMEKLAKKIDCEYVTAKTIESCLKSDTFSSLFCVYWQKEDDEGNRVNNSDLKRIFMLDTVWEILASIGKDILG